MSAASGFKNLTENLTVRVQRAENRKLNVPLLSPFTIASSRLESVGNVAIRIELTGGSVGWGEAPILPSVTAEDQLTAMEKAREACEFLRELPEMKLGDALEEMGGFLPGHQFASVSLTFPVDELSVSLLCLCFGYQFLWLELAFLIGMCGLSIGGLLKT